MIYENLRCILANKRGSVTTNPRVIGACPIYSLNTDYRT